jgi:hypothetical protein
MAAISPDIARRRTSHAGYLQKSQTATEKIQSLKPVTVCSCGFMTNILSGTQYRVSPEGVSLMDETNNLASHLE